MATELLLVPWGWFEEFEPSDVFSPIKLKKKNQLYLITIDFYIYEPIIFFLSQDIYLEMYIGNIGNSWNSFNSFPYKFVESILCIRHFSREGYRIKNKQGLWTEEFIPLWKEYHDRNKCRHQAWINDQGALGREEIIPSGGV